MKDLTPEHMRCTSGVSCPAVYRRDDGKLLIIGADAPRDDLVRLIGEGKLNTYNESAIVIDPELLANVLSVKSES